MTATVTAVVTQVLPNGNLVIEGSREVTVNNEQELIVLSGVVRPKDISPGNVVLSTALGNGQIAYYGSGIIAEKQRPPGLAGSDSGQVSGHSKGFSCVGQRWIASLPVTGDIR